MRGGKESLTGLRFGASNLYFFFFCLLVSIFLVLMEVKFIIHNFYLTCSFYLLRFCNFCNWGKSGFFLQYFLTFYFAWLLSFDYLLWFYLIFLVKLLMFMSFFMGTCFYV
jgi:hypothetical protein